MTENSEELVVRPKPASVAAMVDPAEPSGRHGSVPGPTSRTSGPASTKPGVASLASAVRSTWVRGGLAAAAALVGLLLAARRRR